MREFFLYMIRVSLLTRELIDIYQYNVLKKRFLEM
jgi:hypothetical protein